MIYKPMWEGLLWSDLVIWLIEWQRREPELWLHETNQEVRKY